ncbi:MAG: hypothetical protein WC846_01200 [Candidatus Gracilibacteria bacterium]|jgi:hypothetical protein
MSRVTFLRELLTEETPRSTPLPIATQRLISLPCKPHLLEIAVTRDGIKHTVAEVLLNAKWTRVIVVPHIVRIDQIGRTFGTWTQGAKVISAWQFATGQNMDPTSIPEKIFTLEAKSVTSPVKDPESVDEKFMSGWLRQNVAATPHSVDPKGNYLFVGALLETKILTPSAGRICVAITVVNRQRMIKVINDNPDSLITITTTNIANTFLSTLIENPQAIESLLDLAPPNKPSSILEIS